MSSSPFNIDEFLTKAVQHYQRVPSEWEFSQMFGEDDDVSSNDSGSDSGQEDSWISCLSFDSTGKYLAVGYNCGQVVVLNQQDDQTYQLYTEFKSHDSEFDFLTSMEIEEKINQIEWFPFASSSQLLLTTNDKTIKLLKMWEKSSDSQGPEVNVRPKKVFEGAHSYNINSISFNSDGETFISTDDLRVNLWNVGITNEAFGIVDIKPSNMDELSEVITCSDFHPKSCNIFVYATSKGVVRMGDLRSSALCDKYAKEFEDTESDIGGFFQELVTTISDVKFSPDGNWIVTRDYLTMKLWDPRMESKPFRIVKFHDHLIPKLCDLYENDSIFDKFECSWNGGPSSFRLLTGSYNNNFYICDAFGTHITPMMALKPNRAGDMNQHLDSSQKVLHAAWHPHQDIIALGAKDFGYLYIRKNENE